MNPWPKVKHLFEVDDGLLPDIHVENMTNEEIVSVYEWVMSQCSVAHSPTLWSRDEEKDIPIQEVQYPARQFITGNVDTFRHCLAGLKIDRILLPELSISVEEGGVSFDYRPGEDWNEETVFALFKFLRALRERVPRARIFQADEGCYSSPNHEFLEALANF